MNMNLSLIVIRLIHFLVILFVLLAPFSGNDTLLLLHIITIPFLMLHWVLNNDTCALTMVECMITGGSKEASFIGQLFKDIYLVDNKSIWFGSTVLWLISIKNLFKLSFN